MADPQRRLPVLQPKDDDGEERPPWHWSVIGAVATMLLLLPLSIGAASVARHTYASYVPGTTPDEVQSAVLRLTAGQRIWLGLLSVAGPLVALALASLGGGVLVGRFGGAAGKREAAVGGAIAAAVATSVAAKEFVEQPGGVVLWLFSSVLLFVVAGVFGFLGGIAGIKLRGTRFG